jgi:excinuclease ABC subunit A
MLENIYIKGARQHNLKGIDVEIPRNKLTVITGLSGSGKSSLAFDTLYAEGQRRYVESLSAYARQFLDRMQKPKVEHIEGLSPAIAIEQRTAGANPRSTVATVTEIYDYLRLLYAHTGIPHCPECGKELHPQSAQSITEKILAYPEGRKLMLLAPFVHGRKGEHKEILEKIRSEGFVRARIDGEIVSLDEDIQPLEKNKRHTVEAVVDRLITGSIDSSRLNDSVELALKHGEGLLTVMLENPDPDGASWQEEMISEHLACIDCGVSFGQLQPRNFSFNSPYGACSECHGLGIQMTMDPELVVPDDSLSIRKGAIPGWRRGPRRLIIYYNMLLRKISEAYDCPDMLTRPFKDLPEKIKHIILFGTGEENLEFDYFIRGRRFHWSKPFEGVLVNMQRRMVETESDSVRERLRAYMTPKVCPACNGARLNPVSLAVTVGGLPIHEFNALSVVEAHNFISNLKLSEEAAVIADEVVREVRSRLGFLRDVGLAYLTLDRQSGTLSGGEAQRIRLATQLGCGLVGVLYILDEPSIGLHQRDNDRLLDTLERLRDIGNTVVVVEHDLDTINRADHLLDLGPGAGRHGGELVAAGTPDEVKMVEKSLTGQFLAGKREVEVPKKRNSGNKEKLVLHGVEHNNLKNVKVEIPLGTFCCITGVSGSGKSSLVNEVLTRALNKHFGLKDAPPGKFKKIDGLDNINKAIVIDQSPIGRTPRSNPATYTDAFGHIRKLFAELPESKVRGYKPGRFSFNVKGGRCEDCKGDGIKKIEMQFLSDVYVECSSCGGKRFNNETLNIRYKKHNIADVLDMTVNEAAEFFSAVPALYRKLKTLQDVGLGYVHLGQQATTLSGGEAQRVKLASELSRIPRGHTIYILDEPTTGLHIADIEKLLEVLLKLRDKGNTVLVIEHNLDVIKTADHIIDLGPEGGDGGGTVVASGTPEEVAACKKSYTGQYLKEYLK